MAKRKRTKEQTTIYKTINRTLKIEQHETHKKPGVSQSCSSSDSRRDAVKRHQHRIGHQYT